MSYYHHESTHHPRFLPPPPALLSHHNHNLNSNSTALTTIDASSFPPPYSPREPPLIMSCPRDVRPDFTAGRGYGDVHGTEEHPSLLLLTEPVVLEPWFGTEAWIDYVPDFLDFLQQDITTNAISPNDPRFYAPPPNAPPDLDNSVILPRLERKPADPNHECAADHQCGINKYGTSVPCTRQCQHKLILPSLNSLLVSGWTMDIYDAEGKVASGRVDVGAEEIPWWKVQRAGPVKKGRDRRPLEQLLEEMEEGLLTAKKMIQVKMELFRKNQAMRVEKKRAPPRRSPRGRSGKAVGGPLKI